MRTMGIGAHGEHVRDVQARLGALGFGIDSDEHGVFGESTARAVRAFQQQRQLLVDGLVGEDTWQELVEAGHGLGDRVLYLRVPYFRGDDVRALQQALNLLGFDAGREDGIFGEQTDHAVREFQRNVGLSHDGIVGAVTLSAVARLRPGGRAGPGRAAVREAEALRNLTATLHEARIGIDPGHGPGDSGHLGPTGLSEAEAAWTLAECLAGELERRGAQPVVLRSAATSPGQSERARRANELGVEVLVSLHLGSGDDPRAEGASSYYYGRGDYVSPAGHRLADLIQEELIIHTGVKDGRIHPKSLPLLRETRAPAVHVEPCFITNPREEERLRSEEFRVEVARALADAVERFLASGGPEPPLPGGRTGALVPGGAEASGPVAGHPTEDQAQEHAEQQRVRGA